MKKNTTTTRPPIPAITRKVLCEITIGHKFKARIDTAIYFVRGHYDRTRRAYFCRKFEHEGAEDSTTHWLAGDTRVFQIQA